MQSIAKKSLRIFGALLCFALVVIISQAAFERRAAALDPGDMIDYFVEQLSPYGHWVQNPSYGRVWMPYQPAEWRPYSDGHWVYSDEYGWVWQANEEWGAIPYHYGRWAFADGQWVWVPDQVWGPAWVDWRANDQYIGWAPLPPDTAWGWNNQWQPAYPSAGYYSPATYVFVPYNHFSDEDVRTYVVPRAQNVAILPRVQRYTDYRTVNSHVVNAGPHVDNIERLSGHRIQHVSVEPHGIHNKPLPVSPKHIDAKDKIRSQEEAARGAEQKRREDQQHALEDQRHKEEDRRAGEAKRSAEEARQRDAQRKDKEAELQRAAEQSRKQQEQAKHDEEVHRQEQQKHVEEQAHHERQPHENANQQQHQEQPQHQERAQHDNPKQQPHDKNEKKDKDKDKDR